MYSEHCWIEICPTNKRCIFSGTIFFEAATQLKYFLFSSSNIFMQTRLPVKLFSMRSPHDIRTAQSLRSFKKYAKAELMKK